MDSWKVSQGEKSLLSLPCQVKVTCSSTLKTLYQKPSEKHLGLLSRGSEGQSGMGLINECERLGWIGAENFCPKGLNFVLEETCSLRVVQADKHSIKWTSTSEAHRKEMLGLFNKTLKERTPQSWELYKEA